MIKGKKGQFLLYGLIAGLIAALVIAFINTVAIKKEFPVIGDSSLRLIDASIKAEKALLYTDQSAKNSAYQGIHDLAKNGGCSSGETYDTYRLWTVDSPKQGVCFPSTQDSKNGFFDFFSKIFDTYLSGYEALNLPLNNYELSFDGTNFIGIAENPLNSPIIEDDSDDNIGEYSIKPSFKVNIGSYDFSDYDELKEKAEDLVEACKDNEPDTCIDDNKFDIFNDENFELVKCEEPDELFELLDIIPSGSIRFKIYGFCVKSNNHLFYAYDESDQQTSLRNVVYKFALRFEDIACFLDDDVPVVTECKEFPCNEYLFCGDMRTFGSHSAPLYCFCQDPDEGLNACEGRCPDCACTDWDVGECGGEIKDVITCGSDDRLETRTCKREACGLSEIRCEFDACCGDPICCGNYPLSCDCGGDVCCTEDSSLCGDDGEDLGDLIPSEEEEEGEQESSTPIFETSPEDADTDILI